MISPGRTKAVVSKVPIVLRERKNGDYDLFLDAIAAYSAIPNDFIKLPDFQQTQEEIQADAILPKEKGDLARRLSSSSFPGETDMFGVIRKTNKDTFLDGIEAKLLDGLPEVDPEIRVAPLLHRNQDHMYIADVGTSLYNLVFNANIPLELKNGALVKLTTPKEKPSLVAIAISDAIYQRAKINRAIPKVLTKDERTALIGFQTQKVIEACAKENIAVEQDEIIANTYAYKVAAAYKIQDQKVIEALKRILDRNIETLLPKFGTWTGDDYIRNRATDSEGQTYAFDFNNIGFNLTQMDDVFSFDDLDLDEETEIMLYTKSAEANGHNIRDPEYGLGVAVSRIFRNALQCHYAYKEAVDLTFKRHIRPDDGRDGFIQYDIKTQQSQNSGREAQKAMENMIKGMDLLITLDPKTRDDLQTIYSGINQKMVEDCTQARAEYSATHG
jgi:hypothetical protein